MVGVCIALAFLVRYGRPYPYLTWRILGAQGLEFGFYLKSEILNQKS